tara:strand:- start:4635 stop:5243 length:609 start_codon:yes stop_codon:yes gene_type:complete
MILKNIKETLKVKGPKQAEDDAHTWFSGAKKSNIDPTVVFCENRMMQVGKLNQFTYNPKGKDTLDYYDKKPLVLSLGTVRKKKMIYEMGINLNFIPTPYKWYILETIQKTYSGFFLRQQDGRASNNAYKQPQIMYRYRAIKALLSKYGFEFAIRMYIPSRKSKVYCINYNSWVNASFLSLEKFEGITYDEMIREFQKAKNSR